MKKIRFPLVKPYTDSQELKEVAKVLKSGWLTQGRYVKMLENKIKEYNRVRYAFLVNSATSGLIAAVKSLNLNRRHGIIVPSFSFSATANSIILGGAIPVFCDIDLNTFNIDANKIVPLITKNTKAIMVVHEFGLSADMDKIIKIAKCHNLAVIEDAACALGSEYKNKKTGSFGDVGVFSFHPRKVITCGEGGCVVTNSYELARSIEMSRNHGEMRGKFLEPGFNFRLTDIQGAILFAQFNRIEKIITKRRRLASNYNKLLKPLEKRGILKAPFTPKECLHIYQSYVVLLSKNINRDKVKLLLRSKGIETQIGTYCIPSLDFYRKNMKVLKDSFKNALFASRYSLTLPLYYTLKEKDQEAITEELSRILIKCAE